MSETTKQQAPSYTLASWLDKWLEVYKKFSVKEATYNNYEYAVTLIKKTDKAALPLENINELDLQSVINEVFKMKDSYRGKENIYSKSTMKTIRLSLRQAFRIAFRLHYIEMYPCETLKLPDAPTKQIIPLTHDEQMLVENACKNDILGHLFIFLLRTGLRRAELMHLKWIDYDKEEKEIHITKSKTKAGIRTIDLLPEAQAIIDNQPHINDFIFNSTRNTPITASVLKKLYCRLRKKTGVQHLTNHVCRHTFVTRLCEKGVSAKAIAQIIGHAKTNYVMDIYALIEKKQLRHAIYMLEYSPEEIRKKNNEETSVKLPTVIYNIAAGCAATYGTTVDALVAKIMVESLRETADKAIAEK